MRCTSWSCEEERDVRAIDLQHVFAGDNALVAPSRNDDQSRPRQECNGAAAVSPRASRENPGAHTDGSIVCRSEGMRRVLAEARQVAPTNATVLLLGETGVGKEVIAQAIHDASPRRGRPMIRVSCAAIPTTLI